MGYVDTLNTPKAAKSIKDNISAGGLVSMFFFGDTFEGHAYWWDLHVKSRNHVPNL